ncbi:aminodeoxychorismate/anthranilate synthase component II, partial [Candidatus Pacearchaeota archaeon]|nr:aminodeoxychorismate/anthranilate synthase component II [Candidatus Pacearchaeota archaeon]
DNYDSFTYILKQYFGELDGNPEVFFHDKITVAQIKKMKPTHIVLSPGPGTVEEPKDVGIMPKVIEVFYKTIPILGVCLGHQMIGKFFGGEIVRAPKIMHGKRSQIYHEKGGIFKGLKSPFDAMRYHSLALEFKSQNSYLREVAWADKHLIMGIQHEKYPVFGIQFHPESLGTPFGRQLIRNFLNY